MRRYVVLVVAALFAVSMAALAVDVSSASAWTPPATTTTVALDPVVQYQQCRENGPGRIAAVAHINAFYQTWGQAEADAIVADVNLFVTYCSSYAGAGNVVKTGKVVRACLAEWAGYLPFQGACYASWDTSGGGTGNTIPKYHSALLTSSR